MQLGRIDDETTANVGAIDGGTAANVVPERCVIEAEVRSLDDAKASAAAREMVDAITYAASAAEIDVDTTVEEHFRAYRIPEDHPAVALAAAALRDCGVEPVPTSTGGGSDASAFAAKGFQLREPRDRGRAQPHSRTSGSAARRSRRCSAVAARIVERAAGSDGPMLKLRRGAGRPSIGGGGPARCVTWSHARRLGRAARRRSPTRA